MSAAVGLRDDFTAADLRRLAGKTKEADQARRLLALAAVYDGMDRGTAAQIGGMDRQTLRDWAHRFNDQGPAGLINVKPVGRRPKLSAEQQEALRQLVEAGPDPEKHGVVRWRCVDLQRVLGAQFGVDLSTVAIGRQLKRLGFSHISARPQHPAQRRSRLLKKLPRYGRRGRENARSGNADRSLVSGRDACRTEERSGLPMGQERHATAPAKGSALRKCLSFRRRLSEPQYLNCGHHAARQH